MKELIKSKAAELFFNYGLKSISMEELARISGVSKKTIYQYYQDKNELVSIVVEGLVDMHVKAFNQCAETSGNAVEEMLMQSKIPTNCLPPVQVTFLYELEKFFPAEWEKLTTFRNQFLRTSLQANLSRGTNEGLYRNDLDVELLTDIRLQQYNAAIFPRTFTQRKVQGPQLLFQLTVFYLLAISTTKGETLLQNFIKDNHEN